MKGRSAKQYEISPQTLNEKMKWGRKYRSAVMAFYFSNVNVTVVL
jgi:hypothetical protein